MMSLGGARRIRRVIAALVLVILGAASLTGCLNDLTPQGRWSSPVSDGDFVYVGNIDGVLVRVDAVSHSFDVNWLYPYELDGFARNPKDLAQFTAHRSFKMALSTPRGTTAGEAIAMARFSASQRRAERLIGTPAVTHCAENSLGSFDQQKMAFYCSVPGL